MRLRDVALVGAACDSPFAAHRLPSLTEAFALALAGQVPRSGGLRAVLADVDAANPDLALMEDWWPSDCRLTVTVRHAGQRWRLHPGRHHAPSDVVRVLQDTAESIDPVCRDALGFGASDLLEVALRYVDAAVANAAPSWPDGPRGGPPQDERAQTRPDWFGEQVRATPVQVSEPEIDAALRWWASDRLEAAAIACTDRRAAQRAVTWATGDDAGSNRHGLAVRARGKRWAWPASLMLSRVQDCVAALADEHATPATERMLRRAAVVQVQALLDAGTRDPKSAGPGEVPPATERRMVAGQHEPSRESGLETLETEASEAPWDQNKEHPDQVVYVGRRLITFDTVAVSRIRDTQTRLQEAQRRIDGRDLNLLRQRIGAPDRTDVVPVHVVLTHGVIDVQIMHTGGITVLPVAVLRQVLRAADAQPGGRDLAWQFLEDLCHLPRQVDRVLPAAAEDLWAYWLRQGGLIPPSAPPNVEHADLLVTPTLYDPTWSHAAALDGVTGLADRVGMPDLNDLPSVDVDSDGRVTVWGQRSAQVVCLGMPATAVAADTTGWPVDSEVEDTILPALAAGLRDALCDSGLGLAMSGTDGVYRLEVQVEQDTDTDSDTAQWAAGLTGHPDSAWKLRLGLQVLRTTLDTPDELHLAVGKLLAEPHRGREGVEAALARWQELPPILTVTAAPPTADPAPPGSWLEPTVASHNRAARSVMSALMSRQAIPPGTHHGQAARRYAQEAYVPAALDALHRAAATFDRTHLITSAVRAADSAHAERARRRRWLDLGLRTAHAARIREQALASRDDAGLTRPAEVLVEEVLAVASSGVLWPDRFDIADLTGIAELAMTAGIGADLARRGLADLVVHATGDGAVLVAVTQPATPAAASQPLHDSLPPAVSPARWIAAHRAEGLAEPHDADQGSEAPAESTGATPAGDQREWRPLLEGPDVPGRLAKLNAVMAEHLGWGIEDLFLVLATAAHGDRTFVPSLPPSHLAAEAAALSGRPIGPLAAVVDFLTLTPAAAAADRRFWEQERRPSRLFLRPFVQLSSGNILVPRHLADALYDVTAHMIGEGRLPWPDMPALVDQAANNFRRTTTKALEHQASLQATAAGLPSVAGVEPDHAARAGIPGLPGEIDLLACDAAVGVLWVVEVKHHIDSASPYAIRQRAQRFLKKDGYIDKLLAKAAVVRTHAEQAAALVLGSDDTKPSDGWEVRPLMATARVEPAAFTDTVASMPFVLVRRLDRYLRTGTGGYGT